MRQKAFSSDITIGTDDERSFVAKLTTARLARDNEVLLPQGLNAKDYEANPVIYWNHDYSKPPVGLCLGLKRSSNHWSAKGRLAARPENHVGEWLPDTLHSLMKQNILRGVSVGFDPFESRRPTDRDKQEFGPEIQTVYAKWHLLEYSLCGLMANQDALVEAVSKGVVSRENAKSIFDVDVSPKPKKIMIVVPAIRQKKKKKAIDLGPIVEKAVKIKMAKSIGKMFVR